MTATHASALRRSRISAAILLLSTLAVACGGDGSSGTSGGGGSTSPTPTPGTLAIAVSSGTVNVTQGASGSVTVTVTRGGSFSGAVDVSVEGVPTGVTATAAPAQVASGATTSTITLQAAATAAAGTSTLTVRAKGTGVSDATATVSLTVTAAAPAGGIALALSSNAISVVQGQTGTLGVTLSRSGSFTGSADLTVEGLPSGVTATLAPASLASGATSSTITLTAAATATVGTATITVRAKGTGVTDATATATLSITAAPTPGSFSIAVSPTSASVQQGQSSTFTVTVTRSGSFTGPVSLAATVPAGITAAFAPQSVTGTTSTLTLTAASNATAGLASITLTGSATGTSNATATAPISLTVTAAPPPGGAIAWTYCGTDRPVFFAVQDGSGPWTKVTAGSDNVFRFDITSTKGGVAAVQAVGTGYTTKIYYLTRDEIITFGQSFCDDAGTRNVSGTVAGATGTDLVNIGLGGKSTSVSPSSSTAWTLNNLWSGTRDLIGARATMTLNGLNVSYTLASLVLRRDVSIGSGGTQPVVDFGAASAFAPASATLTLGNLGSDVATVVTQFSTANSASAVLLYPDISATSTATRTWRGVPTAKQVSGDLHTINASATVSLTNSLVGRQVTAYSAAVSDRTLTFGPALGTVSTTTVSGGGMVRFRSQYTLQSQYNRLVIAQYQQSTNNRIHEIQTSSGYSGTGQIDVSVPDLSSLSGWLAAYGLVSGVSTTWTLSASGWTGGTILGNIADGNVTLSATTGGTITP